MFKLMNKILVTIFVFVFMLVPINATDYYNVNVGYQAGVSSVLGDFAYGGALAGTEGGEPLDSVELHLVDSPYNSGLEYRVYTTSGWSEWFSTWETASNNNEAILGLQIQLKDFPNANVYYQSYRKGLGWGIWVSNGSTSGQLNSAYPITGFRVQVDEIGVNYSSNNNGVPQVLRANGETQGTGSLETVSMNLISADSGSIEYRTYIRNTGWTDWASNGSILGSSDSVIEALEARLVDLPQYSVQIQPQVEGEWWGYAYDGQTAGAPGINKALTAYRVEIVQRKNSTSTTNATTNVNSSYSSSHSTISTCPSSLGSYEVVVWTNDSDLVASTNDINSNQIRTEGNKTFFSFLNGSTVSFSALIIDTNLSTLSFDTNDIAYACFGSHIAQTLGYETKELSFSSVTTYDSFDYSYYYNHYQDQWSWYLFDVVDLNAYEYYEYNAFYPPIG